MNKHSMKKCNIAFNKLLKLRLFKNYVDLYSFKFKKKLQYFFNKYIIFLLNEMSSILLRSFMQNENTVTAEDVQNYCLSCNVNLVIPLNTLWTFIDAVRVVWCARWAAATLACTKLPRCVLLWTLNDSIQTQTHARRDHLKSFAK